MTSCGALNLLNFYLFDLIRKVAYSKMVNCSDLLSSNLSEISANPPPNEPVWTALVVTETIITAAALFFTVPVLLPFFWDKKLHTAFNVYVCNLLVSDFVWFAFQSPLDIINNLYARWKLGDNVCTIYLYLQWTVSMVQPLVHVSISLSRFWAVTFPNSYREKHTFSLAMKLSICAWMVANFINVPGIALNHLSRPPLDNTTCSIDAQLYSQKIWVFFVQFVSVLYELIVIGVFPVIWYKRRARQKIAQISEAGRAAAGQPTLGNLANNAGQSKNRGSGSFKLLAILTVMVLIFWSPLTFYLFVLPFLPSFNPTINGVVFALFEIQLLTDPIIFCITIKDLRDAVFGMFRFR